MDKNTRNISDSLTFIKNHMMTKDEAAHEVLIEESKERSRCPGCDCRFVDISSFPALSRYGHGDLCSDCGRREAFEGDFVLENILKRIALAKSINPPKNS